MAGVPALLVGCGGMAPVPSMPEKSCQVDLVVLAEYPAVRKSALAGDAGGAVGAGLGALAGLQTSYLAIFAAPIGAVIGAGYGAACAAASTTHPTVVDDLAGIARQVSAEPLVRALREELAAPRVACRYSGLREANGTADHAIVEVKALEVELDCMIGRQRYVVIAEWQASRAGAPAPFERGSTRCYAESARDIDAWLLDPDRTAGEIGEALSRTGRRVAKDLFDEERRGTCKLRFDAAGRIEP